MATLDYTLPLQVKSPDMMGMLNQGSQLAQFYTQNKTEGELNRLYQESGGDINKMLELGQQSKLARFIVPQIQAQQQARLDAQLKQQKDLAEIGKTNSEAFKNNQQGGGYKLDNAGKLMGSANQALMVAAQTGDPLAAKLALNNAYKAGAIDDATFNQFNGQIDIIGNDPERLKNYARSIVFAQSRDPDKYLFSTADNQLDNQTAIANNIRTTDATMRGQDITSATADKNRAQDKILAEQKIALERGEFETMTGTDGKAYAVYKDGRVEPLLLKSGEAFTPQAKGTPATLSKNEETQRISRVNTVLDEVEKILPQSTNSYFGRGLDYGARIVGKATPGDMAAAQLGTLGGQLVALMPKMSGPQSDKDVEMYKQMAGKLDDATVPIEIRQAALQTIRELNNKYSEMNSLPSGIPYRSAGQVQTQDNQAKLNNILFGK